MTAFAMKLQVRLVVLLTLSLPEISEEAKPARLGVTRSYGVGSLWAEIQIDRTVHVSHDYREAAGLTPAVGIVDVISPLHSKLPIRA